MVEITFTNNELGALAKIVERKADGQLMRKLAAFLDDCDSLGGTAVREVRLTAEVLL